MQDEFIIRNRQDGSLSSLNPIDEHGRVHGVRVTFYGDGKTVYSKTTLQHGIKHGPALRYYRNGQLYEHSSYRDGRKHGPARKYYKNGKLLAEFVYDHGHVKPGLKEYKKDGTLVSTYPEIRFRELDHLERFNRLDLVVYPEPDHPGITYYLVEDTDGRENRIYLIPEQGSAMIQHYVATGGNLQKEVHLVVKIPTALGNLKVLDLRYPLEISHPY